MPDLALSFRDRPIPLPHSHIVKLSIQFRERRREDALSGAQKGSERASYIPRLKPMPVATLRKSVIPSMGRRQRSLSHNAYWHFASPSSTISPEAVRAASGRGNPCLPVGAGRYGATILWPLAGVLRRMSRYLGTKGHRAAVDAVSTPRLGFTGLSIAGAYRNSPALKVE